MENKGYEKYFVSIYSYEDHYDYIEIVWAKSPKDFISIMKSYENCRFEIIKKETVSKALYLKELEIREFINRNHRDLDHNIYSLLKQYPELLQKKIYWWESAYIADKPIPYFKEVNRNKVFANKYRIAFDELEYALSYSFRYANGSEIAYLISRLKINNICELDQIIQSAKELVHKNNYSQKQLRILRLVKLLGL